MAERAMSELHENLARDEEIKTGSERKFGLVFFVFFALVGIAPLWHRAGGAMRVWALILAAIFLVLSLFWTVPLKPLNRGWLKFGLLLHAIINPVVMALMFYVVVTPFGIGMRIFGKKPLGLRRQPEATTYWVLRDPPGPAPETMKNQF
jgi:ABC-type phosphate transport system permease subunit